MNFLEAINTGKEFRTKDFPKSRGMSQWFHVGTLGFILGEQGEDFCISNPDFFNAEFEVKEKKISEPKLNEIQDIRFIEKDMPCIDTYNRATIKVLQVKINGEWQNVRVESEDVSK